MDKVRTRFSDKIGAILDFIVYLVWRIKFDIKCVEIFNGNEQPSDLRTILIQLFYDSSSSTKIKALISIYCAQARFSVQVYFKSFRRVASEK